MKFVLILAGVILLGLLGTPTFAQGEKTQLPFDWDQEAGSGTPFYYSVRDSEGNFKWDTNLWWPFVYTEGTLPELNQGAFAPGRGTVLAVNEQYGNVLLVCHSGTVNQVPLECEEWRRFFEPIDQFWMEGRPYTPEEEERLEGIRRERMEQVIGWRVRLLQGNSPEQLFEVVGVSHIPHEQVPEFRSNALVALDYLAQEENALDVAPWQEAMESQTQHVILVLCGWGPYIPGSTDQDPFGDNYWGTWSRYGVLLRPIEVNSSS